MSVKTHSEWHEWLHIEVSCPGCSDKWDALVHESTDIATHCECGEEVRIGNGPVLVTWNEHPGSKRWLCSRCGARYCTQLEEPIGHFCVACGRRGMFPATAGFLVIWDEVPRREREPDYEVYVSGKSGKGDRACFTVMNAEQRQRGRGR